MSGGVQRAHRRLAAILAADVVGYSSLMSRNEEAALGQIKSLRRQLLEPKVNEHEGRVFKTTGDGLLAEFPSPVEAVRCAVAIQEALGSVETPDALRLRIGINLGDIIVEEDGDIFGDGVNVAARLGTDGRRGRHMHFRQGLRRGPRQAEVPLRGPRREAGQEHRPAGAGVQACRRGFGAGYLSPIPARSRTARQAFHRGPAVCEYEWGSRAGVFR